MFYSGLLSGSAGVTDENLCFHFSWLGITNKKEEVNCSSSEFQSIPCIEPTIESSTPPDFLELWDNDREKFTCYLRPGYSCISHKYEFNGALVNSSYFCGKMIQDSSSVIETHCYSQKVGGHDVTACACKSGSSEEQLPCNASRRNVGTWFGIILLVFGFLFDKCGIISNIRTNLRQNLVSALKNRDLSQKFDSTPKSAKQYVYDLLVAEYLWNHNYSYTLSVFASEAPLLVNFSKHMTKETDSDETSSNAQQKLQGDYVCHALETLGIVPEKDKGQSIIRQYAESDLPLLLCILQCVKIASFSNEAGLEKEITETKYMKHQSVQTVENVIALETRKKKIAIAKRKLIQQKSLFEDQLKQKENELKEQTVTIQNQLSVLEKKMEQAKKLMHTYNMKEKQLDEYKHQENLRILQKETELSMKERLLFQEAKRLEQERSSYSQFQGNFKKLQEELSKAKKGVPESQQSCNLSMKDVEIQTEFESFVLARSENNLLSQEKQDLNGLVQAQQSRIDQLSLRVVHLTRKLEETQLRSPNNIGFSPSIIKVVNTNTVISDNSSTEDILQDAKMRLRRLEEESMKADQYYTNFISNSSQ
ncbi:hypothetical protein QAD02_010782 [Eretmocerus hayati]|uniref:Uncharacterized protein n=1 Tax=Eretmocerus hayati TaxID=131215 RepID=A0ACC2NWL6_9HYME|nr:hypothetical protein QAD02_010782 [Eretmocerus hayati]